MTGERVDDVVMEEDSQMNVCCLENTHYLVDRLLVSHVKHICNLLKKFLATYLRVLCCSTGNNCVLFVQCVLKHNKERNMTKSMCHVNE